MIETPSTPVSRDSMEDELGDALRRAETAAATVVPILRHVLSSEDNSMFGDEIVARIRGMVRHLAVQLLDRKAGTGAETFTAEHAGENVARLSDLLIESPAFVSHLHSLALETQLSDRLHARFGTDQVLTPLLQSRIASSDADTAALAMRFLASQARHCQSQRRMKLPLLELPGDLLHQALLAVRALDVDDGAGGTDEAARNIRQEYDEGSTRLGLAARLLAGMGAAAPEALSINHAGVTLFASALSLGSGLDRDEAVLCTHETQAARLALALRSAGAKPSSVREQCLALYTDIEFPDEFDGIGPDRAAAILAAGGGFDGA